MTSARVHARNLAANWIGHGANLVVMFFLTPFIIHTLGPIEYGIWSLLWVFTGYMGFLDLGVRASTSRHVVLYLGRGEHNRVDEIVRTSLGFFCAIGLLVVAVGAVLGWGFPSFFRTVPLEYQWLAAALLPVLGANLGISAVGAVFSSVLVAHDRFDLTRGVDLAVLAVRTAGTVVALNLGYGIIGLTVVTIGCGLAGTVGNYALARHIYPRLRVWPLALEWSRLRELLSFGVAAFICAIASKLVGQTDLLVVGALISMPMVTVYSVGAMLVYYSSAFLGLIGSTLFPSLQRAVAKEDISSARWYYLRQVRLALAFGLPAFLGFIMFGRPFIHLWMEGPEFTGESVTQAAMVMAVLSLAKLLFLPGAGSGETLAAFGRYRFNAVIAIVEGVLNLGVSIFFVVVLKWGLLGVAAGTLAAGVFLRSVIHPQQALRTAGIRAGTLLKIVASAGVAGAGFAGWCFLVRWLIPADSWPMFALGVVLALVGYAPLALVFVVPAEDRRRVLRAVGLARPNGGEAPQEAEEDR